MNIALDTETHLIKKSCPAPELVCVSIAYRDEQGVLQEELYDRYDGIAVAEAMLANPEAHFVGHKFCYDMGVLSAEKPEFIPLWFKAAREGRIHDTMLDQMVLDNATGELKFEWDDDLHQYKKADFSLARVAQRHLGINIHHLKRGSDVWRLRYHELTGIPVTQWPEGARDYAIMDAVLTYHCHEKQYVVADHLYPDLPTDQSGTGQVRFSRATERIPGSAHTLRAAWGLSLMELWGVRTNGEAIDALESELTLEYDALTKDLLEEGLMRLKKTKGVIKPAKTMAQIYELVVQHYQSVGVPVPYTPKGKVSTARATLTMTDTPGIPAEPRLVKVADHGAVSKLLNTYVPVLRRGENHAVHPSYNPIVETFRTSCRDPNLQNPPRKGGVRECFEARPGMTFAFCDYGTLEMATLAQVNLWLFGNSPLADALWADEDVHVSYAAEMLGIESYEKAMALIKAGDEQMKDARQLCFHPDTEILTFHNGWKKISELSYEDYVAQAVPGEGGVVLEWTKPLAITCRPMRGGEPLLRLQTEGIDLRVTPDHRMLAVTQSGRFIETTAKDLGKHRGWVNAGRGPDGYWEPNEQLLRLAVATQADGSIRSHQIKFGFTRKRKIERMRWLLTGVPHRENNSSQGATCFTLFGANEYPSGIKTDKGFADDIASMLSDKCFDERWINLSSRSRQAVLDEVKHWDSERVGKSVSFTFCTTTKKNADILQAIASLEGKKTHLRKSTGKKTDSDVWLLTIRDHKTRRNDRSRSENLTTTRQAYVGDVVCLSVPSTYVLVRDGNPDHHQIPVIAGQSKIPNYGCGGGMGKDALVSYARGYGVQITPEQASYLIDLYKRRWAMDRYFDYCSSLVDRRGGSAKHVQFIGSGVYRGNVVYTAICNSMFQHLAAMGAKEAVFLVQEECWAVPSSPLYGCRPWLFAHDEIGMEIPFTGWQRHAAAMRLQELMIFAMKSWCPDVPIKADVGLCFKWEKGVPQEFDESGMLIPMRPMKNEKGKMVWVRDYSRS